MLDAMRPGGGTGRRARLKIVCPQGRVGSTPTLATIYKGGLITFFKWGSYN